jgi:hypothetical protein
MVIFVDLADCSPIINKSRIEIIHGSKSLSVVRDVYTESTMKNYANIPTCNLKKKREKKSKQLVRIASTRRKGIEIVIIQDKGYTEKSNVRSSKIQEIVRVRRRYAWMQRITAEKVGGVGGGGRGG